MCETRNVRKGMLFLLLPPPMAQSEFEHKTPLLTQTALPGGINILSFYSSPLALLWRPDDREKVTKNPFLTNN
jgi:hypothetical protein